MARLERAGRRRRPKRCGKPGWHRAVPGASVSPDVTPPAPTAVRGPGGFFNERPLLSMVDAVHARTRDTLQRGGFPLLYGADCAVLLGAIPSFRDVRGHAGLLFVDAHEDATTMEQSTTGEAANMEIAFLLGLTASDAPESLRRRLPALEPSTIVLLGQRDDQYHWEIGVSSIAGRVPVHTAVELRQSPPRITARAADQLTRRTPGWWLHIDLDVLDGREFAACGAAHDPATPGGLTWTELTAVAATALYAGGCRGWSIGVYNTDLDPSRQAAQRIIRFITDVVASEGPPQPEQR